MTVGFTTDKVSSKLLASTVAPATLSGLKETEVVSTVADAEVATRAVIIARLKEIQILLCISIPPCNDVEKSQHNSVLSGVSGHPAVTCSGCICAACSWALG
jgi:hypothetical protein